MSLTKEQKDELVTSYAALALYDGESEVSSEQIKTLIAATGNEVEPYWPIIFSKFLSNGKLEKIVLAGGATASGGSAAAAAAPGADAGAGEAKKEKKEEKKEEEMDLGAGMDMFGGGGDGY